MTYKTFKNVIKRINLEKCEILIPHKAFYIRKKVTQCRKFRSWQEIIILTNGTKKVGGIQIMGNFDFFCIIFEEYREKHYLSSFLRAGIMEKRWPDLKTCTCYNRDDDNEYKKIVHLANLAKIKVEN